MTNYTNLFKNILLIVLLIAIFKLYNEKNELRSMNTKMLKRHRQLSEKVVEKKLNEIDSLKQQIKREQYLIDEALIAINDLQNQKTNVEKVYVEKITEINSFDANQLKNYFKDELK
jgi:predicted Holliday junction resolvase-like endonuclease